MRRYRLLFVSLLFCGCVDADPDRIQLSVSVDGLQIAVEEHPLVTQLTGSFDMTIAVGDLASDQSTVEEPPSLSLVRASDQSLVRVIDALPVGDGFPVTLRADQNVTLEFALTEENLLAVDDKTAVCEGGELQLVGSLRDTLSGGRGTAFSSGPVTPTGC